MTYLVVRCSRCGNARVADAAAKTVQCGHCLQRIDLRETRAHHRADDLAEAQHAAGLVNARAAGAHEAFAAAHLETRVVRAQYEDAADRAAARARGASAEPDRANAVARALGEFDAAGFAQALERAGLPGASAEDHLKRMLVESILFEPRPGLYRVL